MDVLTPEEGVYAVQLARTVLENVIGSSSLPCPCLTPIFGEKRGVFVTLTRAGKLRGCIGFPYPVIPLGEAIREAALSAAREDPRFPPVQAPELATIRIEVTILTVPARLDVPPGQRPFSIIVGRHGLIARGMGRSGLLLPQVPVECCWDSVTFLDHTCVKAGLPTGCWRRKEVEIFTFEGQIFHEG